LGYAVLNRVFVRPVEVVFEVLRLDLLATGSISSPPKNEASSLDWTANQNFPSMSPV
jgi:hypothetical protein